MITYDKFLGSNITIKNMVLQEKKIVDITPSNTSKQIQILF